MRRLTLSFVAVLVVAVLAVGGAFAGSPAVAGPKDAGGGAVLARITSGQATANATLTDVEGSGIGTARFAEVQDGVEVNVDIERGGLQPGEHGIHIHETGEVEPGFEAAGEHFDPTGAEHGFDNPRGPHAGDLENITVEEDGSASYATTTDRISLFEGENAILDSDGSALVVHENADDYVTDPDGGSGDPVAAGAIEGGVASRTQALLFGLGALVLIALLAGVVVWRVRRTSKTYSK